MNATITTTTTATITPATDATQGVFDAFLSSLDLSPTTIASYTRNLRPLAAWLRAEGLRLEDVTPSAARAYKRHLMETHKPASVNAYLSTARRLYAFIEDEMDGMGNAYRSPFTNVRGAKGAGRGTSKAHDALTREQAKRVAAHEGDGLKGLRDRAMVRLSLTCALRCVELARMTVGDYRRVGTARAVSVWGKGHASADTLMYVDDATAEAIDRYLSARGGDLGDDAPLFAGTSNNNRGGAMTTRAISQAIKDTMKAEGIDDHHLTAHSLRHTSITLVVESGATLIEAQTHARHSDPATTQIYLHLREAMQGRCQNTVAAAIA